MSDVREDLKVGDSVYVFDIQQRRRKCTVTKIGRKWLTVTCERGTAFQFDRTNRFMGQTDYGCWQELMTEEQITVYDQVRALLMDAGSLHTRLDNIRREVWLGDLVRTRRDLREALTEFEQATVNVRERLDQILGGK